HCTPAPVREPGLRDCGTQWAPAVHAAALRYRPSLPQIAWATTRCRKRDGVSAAGHTNTCLATPVLSASASTGLVVDPASGARASSVPGVARSDRTADPAPIPPPSGSLDDRPPAQVAAVVPTVSPCAECRGGR